MSKKLSLTLACGDYEIIRPLKEGTVQPDGIELNILTAADSATRHWRFLRNEEFDIAECSASTYLVARDRGLPFRAIPVFLHRRFRHGFIFTNTGKGIVKPADLIGKKVGAKAYQVTAVLWLRGILEEHYGVPHTSVEWFTELDEDVDFNPPEGLRLSQIDQSKSIETMLAEGEIDALLHPDIIDPIIEKDPRVGRLFPNYKDEEIAYYNKTGIFPIMHVTGIRQELVEKYPWIVPNLYQAFEQSKALAMKRMRNPRLVPLAWYQEAWEEQEQLLGPDPWAYGLGEQNRNNLETLVGYSHAHNLISRKIPLEELFMDVSQGRKRGHFRT
ncbi:4,5-dihydroxyphthalate decarboxylase [Hartmannibacter diazotrophicus]|uniref:4,5-dihydroxyphthalate decarboxylase n=1 Tax=Hartmannibacter diazotrophicus TaxID=1482074 RepID=A0A2C9D0X2_9HYPH|nr:ABC transporter substrate-binding protein [Hartmannibacter diazotrophicus]SON53900.1 4,5-dihydroxyphthalate decarboxylase [Hartmannibacter diazotrophicus]